MITEDFEDGDLTILLVPPDVAPQLSDYGKFVSVWGWNLTNLYDQWCR